MSPHWIKLFFLLFFGLTAACTVDIPPVIPPNTCLPDAYECLLAKTQKEARRNLGEFKPYIAFDQFELMATYETRLNKDHCESSYGLVLASLQKEVATFNQIIGPMVQGLLGIAPADLLVKAASFRPLVESPLGVTQDLGEALTSMLDQLGGPLRDIAKYAAVVEDIRGCEFLMGPVTAVDAFGDKEALESLRRELGYQPFLPIRLLTNKSLDRLPPGDLAVEIRLGDKWDAVEARAFGGISNLVVVLFDFLSAHSWYMLTDIGQILNALGIDLRYAFDCATDPNSWLQTKPKFPASDTNGNGVIDNTSECLKDRLAADFYLPQILRRIGFLFADNDGFLDRSSTRWDKYFPEIDNVWATGTEEFRLIFDSMVARAARYDREGNKDELDRFMLIYQDNNSDGKVGTGDQIGLNIRDLALHLPPAVLESVGMTQKQLQDLIRIGLDVLRIEVPNDKVVDDAVNVMVKTRDALLAVDDPSVAHEPIELADFQGLLQVSGFFGSEPIPNVIGVDLTAYFTNPKPLRAFLPYWEALPDVNATYRNEWIIETEASDGYYRDHGRYMTVPLTNGTVEVLRYWEMTGDKRHFASEDGLNKGSYWGFDPAELNNFRPADALYKIVEFTSELRVDCFGPVSSGDTPQEPLTYFYMQDPSFNGALLTNMGKIKKGNADAYEDSSCSGQPDTFLRADLWSFHRAFISFAAWFARNNTIIATLNSFGGGG